MSDEAASVAEQQSFPERVRRTLRGLYFGGDGKAIRFQLAMLCLDVAILGFFVAGPYLRMRGGQAYILADYLIAVVLAFELSARALAAPNLRYWLMRPMTWVDIVILGTLLFPNQLHNFAFLRALRIWAISQSKLVTLTLYRLGYGRIEDIFQACVNFVVFLFVVAGFVYSNFFYSDPGIWGFVDALYYTVATVTTTGFGFCRAHGGSASTVAPAWRRMKATSAGCSMKLIGTSTAPMRASAKHSAAKAWELRASTATRSPGATPCAVSPWARRVHSASNSA